MSDKKLIKWGSKVKLGEARELVVKNFFEKQGHYVEIASFTDDVVHKIDLIVFKDRGKMLYVQVKGFHEEWKNDTFVELIAKAKKDKAIPLIARVNKKFQIYFWNPTKK